MYHYKTEWEEMDKKMKEMEEENRRRARENARIESIQSKQKKKQKSKENGKKQKGYVAGAKAVNDDAKFIVTRISPIADLKEIKEYCGVCFDGESYEEDPIIFCEGCDVAVHLACYGLRKVPEGDWMCRACSTRSSKAVKKQCCLCPCPGGALKPTRDNRWAHLFCAQWIPELFISNTKAMEPIENMNKLVKERLSMKCVVCKTRNQGACIQCAYGNCTVPVHPMCAMQAGMRMEVRTDKKNEEVVDYRVYCEKHAAVLDKAAKVVEQRQQQQEDKKNPSRNDDKGEEKSDKKDKDVDNDDQEKDDRGKESEKENNKKDGNKSASVSPAKVMKLSSTQSKAEVTTPVANKNDKSVNENSSYRDDMVSPMSPKHGPTDAMNEHMEKALEFPAPELPSDINEFLMDERQDAQIAVSKMKAAAAYKAAAGGIGNSLVEKCIICVKMKKGATCGTSNAPLKCLRRKENVNLLQKEMDNNLGMKSPQSESKESKILGPKEELERLNKHKHMFEKFAPEDEVTAELFRAQAALGRVVNVTRMMASELLERIEADQENVQKRLENMERTVKDVEAYENRYRGGRWRVEKLRAGGQLPALADGGDGSLESLNASGALIDPLCTIVAMEDALCCVCGGGQSEPPNEIMFCERCEVAVHQDCYGVGEIPDGDWLCWPCQIVEDRERETNAPKTRPPRYMREAGDGVMYDPRVKCELCPVMRGAMRAIVPAKLSSPLSEMKKCMPCAPNSASPPGTTSTTPGNVEAKMENTDAKDVVMKDAEPEKEKQQDTPMNIVEEKMVSPSTQKPSAVKDDAKALVNQTPKLDSPANMRPHKLRWAHVVCAKWMPGISCDLFSNEPEAIRGEESIPSRLLEAKCAVCGSKEGAKVQCSKEGCRMYFHPLCARRANYYIEYGPQTEGTPVGHYCKNHSTQAKRDAGRNVKPSKIKGVAASSSYVKSSVKRRPPTAEEITLLKRARVGLETLRLLCERVNKREKIRRDELESLGTLWKAQLNGQASGPVLKPGELEAAEDHGFIRQGPAVLYLTSSSIEEVAPSVPAGYELAHEEDTIM